MFHSLHILVRSLFADVEFFSEALERYNRQHAGAEAIVLRRSIGMLMVDAVQMRNKLIPSPMRCLYVSYKPSRVIHE